MSCTTYTHSIHACGFKRYIYSIHAYGFKNVFKQDCFKISHDEWDCWFKQRGFESGVDLTYLKCVC